VEGSFRVWGDVRVIITKITTQKRNKERFNVFVDRGSGEEFGFSVDQDVFIKYRLKKGISVDEAHLRELMFEDEIKKAYHLSIKYLSFRMRSRKEIVDYLSDKGYPIDVIENVLEKLMHYKFVNDLEFAKSFVRSRIHSSTKGPSMIKQELLQKGVSNSMIEQALAEFPSDVEKEKAHVFAEKQLKKLAKKSFQQSLQQIGQSLHSKGFSREIAQVVLSSLKEEKTNEDEWEALSYQGEKAHKKCKTYQGWEYEQRMKRYLFQRGFSLDLVDKYLTSRSEQDGKTL
jgi:regulatory protein